MICPLLRRGPLRLWVVLAAYLLSVGALLLLPLAGLPNDIASALAFLRYVLVGTALAAVFGWGQLRATLGLTLPRDQIPTTLATAALAALVIAGLSYAVEQLYADVADSTGLVLRSMGAGETLRGDLLLVLAICALAPLGEEALFRGMIFKGLFDGLQNGPGWLGPLTHRGPALGVALVVSAVVFATAHGGEGQQGMVIAVLTLQGALYGLCYAMTGSIWGPVLAHSLNNTGALLQYIHTAPDPVPMVALAQHMTWGLPVIALLLLATWRALTPRPRGRRQ